jgi:hypothetical protein
MVIDLDRGIVSIPAGESAITEVTEQTIAFGGKDEGVKDTTWSGYINRISGAGSIMVCRGAEEKFSTELACKPAKPLF